ncbi:MAG TPA: CHAT domain-containing protein [Nitrososphaeraceae archaeon]|nr:CHAT domain-containing protein [Nitrososphaeraceae archaeon]
MSTLPIRDLFIEIKPRSGAGESNILKLWTKESEILKTTTTKIIGEIANRKLEDIQEQAARLLGTSPDRSLLREVGKFLFEFLPSSISSFIQHEYELVKEDQQILGLKIVSKDPGSIDLPWELLYITPQEEFLALHPNASIIRYVPVPTSSPPLIVEPPLRIVFVLTNPKDERLMRADEELNAIKGTIDNMSSFQTDVLWEPTLEAFRKKLVEIQPHIIHYIGHGGIGRGEGNLILHDSLDKTYWLSPTELSTILPPTVLLLCLSTCFTSRNYQIQAFNRLGQTWGQYNLPSMVVNQFPLSREGVSVFWREFYSTLREAGELMTSIKRSRQEVAQSHPLSVDWASFVLHLRSPSDKLFSYIPPEITTRRAINRTELSMERRKVKALEIQINSLTSILNNLKMQVSNFDNPPAGLQKAIEGTEKRHYDLLSELRSVKASLVPG